MAASAADAGATATRLDESLIIYPEVEYLFAEVNQSPQKRVLVFLKALA